MADIEDVMNALAGNVATVLGQNPFYAGQVFTTTFAKQARVYVGWPSSSDLDKDLAQGITNVAIYPTNITKTEVPFHYKWKTLSYSPPTTTGVTSGSTLTLTGTGSTNQGFGIGLGRYGYSVHFNQNETINSALARLSAIIPNSTVSNNVLTLPSGYKFSNSPNTANIGTNKAFFVNGADTVMYLEVGRQTQIVSINIFAPDPFTRTLFGTNIKPGLDNLNNMQTADGLYTEKPIYSQTMLNDYSENKLLWGRTEHYGVSYPSVQIQTFHPAFFVGGQILAGNNATLWGQS
jgi:hypothetical protein